MTKHGHGILKLTCPFCGKEYIVWRSQYALGKYLTCGKSVCKQALHTKQAAEELETELGEPLKDVIKRLYIDKHMPMYRLAQRLGVSNGMAKRLVEFCGFEVRDMSEAHQGCHSGGNAAPWNW